MLPFCSCMCFRLNSLLRNVSSLIIRKGNVSCRTVLLDQFICTWDSFACNNPGLYSRGPTSDPPCREVICLHVRAVLSPACPLCLSTVAHYHSAMWMSMMWLAASCCIWFLISSASFIQAARLQPFLIVSRWLPLHV